MNILLPGKSGQAGRKLLSCDRDSAAALTAEFVRTAALARLVRAVPPEVIVNAAARAIRANVADASKCGPYHSAAAGESSWRAYARFVIEWARARGHALMFAPDVVRTLPIHDDPNAAARPFNSRLDTHRQQQTVGSVLPR